MRVAVGNIGEIMSKCHLMSTLSCLEIQKHILQTDFVSAVVSQLMAVVLDTPVVVGSTMEADLSTLPDSDNTIAFNRAR